MATYSSYKKVFSQESIVDGAITDDKLAPGARRHFGVKWVFGNPGECTTGCCCQWTVPNYVRRLNVEAWGAGGNGHGACSCNRCHHYQGAGGGSYNSKRVETAEGCQYTVCAGGVYRCRSRNCTACSGCPSYVTGYNLSSFCAVGGDTGRANTSWTTLCYQDWACCLDKGDNGGDFGFTTQRGVWGGVFCRYDMSPGCHCWTQFTAPTPAAGIGTDVQQYVGYCWIRCGCWTAPYGHGGQGGMSSYCGRCCGQGGTGGSGLVKITYW